MKILGYPLMALALAGMVLPASAIDEKQFGTTAICISGNCENGEGTIRLGDGSEATGLWTRGRYTGQTAYKVRNSIDPSRITELTVNDDGLPLEGTMLRGQPGKGAVGEFTGTFAVIHNPFLGRDIGSYHVGKYSDRVGRSYEGEFSYIPTRVSGTVAGYFIFMGARIDETNDEVVQGLFVSETAFPGMPILFRKARPDYLVKLQQDYATEQNQAAAAARVAEDERRSGESMSSFVGVVGGLLSMGGGNIGSLKSSALSALTDGLTGKKSASELLNGVVSQVVQKSAGGSLLGKTLGGDTSSAAGVISSLTNMGKSLQPMTRAQYAAQMVASLADGKTGSDGQAGGADLIASAVVDHTANTVISAFTGKGGNPGLGKLGTSMLKQVVASHSESAIANREPRGPVADDPGTVQLPYTPGKGFLDPVTGRYIKNMEEMSCDNVTTWGNKLRDLPKSKRVCVDTTKVSKKQPAKPKKAEAAAAKAVTPTKEAAAEKAPAKKRKRSGGSDGRLDPVFNERQGEIAQVEKIALPDGLHFDSARMHATNDGIYLSATGTGKGTVVVKRTAGRGSPRGWLTTTLPEGDVTFAPSSLRPEDPDVFSIRWVSRPGRYGSRNINNNGLSQDYKQGNEAVAFIPLGAKSNDGRHWVIGTGGRIYLRSSGGDGSTDFDHRFDQIYEHGDGIFPTLATSNDEGSRLYIASSDRKSVVEIKMDGSAEKYDLSEVGSGYINTMIFGHNRLWIGIGDQIVTLTDKKIAPFFKMNVVATYQPTFCLAGTQLYTADGQVMDGIDITPSSPRSYLQSTHNIRAEDAVTLALVKGSLMGFGIYCAEGVGSPVIYSQIMDPPESLDVKLLAIGPR
jgi:hypothetical protein